ncbi:hypothetical protein LTR36_001375 [Oleoguttula mirabilis]|uniref:Uncharacterized protein n=1 Tax=Oleoguttula mirabilis TaxID=1507867 RepID=A0AAV9JRJ8_9PEZI|nr:hypothetical protein LTR36_001375 [Oleoguttula mirabilis]
MHRRTAKTSFYLVLLAAFIVGLIWRQPAQWSSSASEAVIVRRSNQANQSVPSAFPVVHDQTSHGERLRKRGVLDDCHNRGCSLMKLCETSEIEDKWHATFTTFNQIGQYGWTTQPDEKNDDEAASSKPALNALNIPEVGDGSWTKIKWLNSVAVDVEGHHYLASEAYYTNIFNPSHGAILAVDNHAPKDTSPDMESGDITPLYRWSDITFLTWLSHTTSDAELQGIKHIIRVNVINEDTVDCITNFVPDRNIDNLPQYPGLQFESSSVAGLTLLGPPNGVGVGFFLLQHKARLGKTRRVTSVRVWESSTPDEIDMMGSIPCMLFELSD